VAWSYGQLRSSNRDEDHREVRERRVALQVAAAVEAVLARHHHVHEKELRPRALGDAQRICRVLCHEQLVAGTRHASELEIWSVPESTFGSFVTAIPPPLGIGKVERQDGVRSKASSASRVGSRTRKTSRRVTFRIRHAQEDLLVRRGTADIVSDDEWRRCGLSSRHVPAARHS
jgi:hypothetical protein